MLNISHSVYPEQTLDFNTWMNYICNRPKVEEKKERDIYLKRPLGFFRVEIRLLNSNTKFINYLKK